MSVNLTGYKLVNGADFRRETFGLSPAHFQIAPACRPGHGRFGSYLYGLGYRRFDERAHHIQRVTASGQHLAALFQQVDCEIACEYAGYVEERTSGRVGTMYCG